MIVRFLQSSIGKKWIVALTGLILIAYVLGHLVGNLQIFLGPEPINRYAHFLHSLGPLLWVVRIFLLAAFATHILTTILLAHENRSARPARYAVNASVQAKAATKTMVISGLIVLCFAVYHILHFTTRTAHVSLDEYWAVKDAHGYHQVYNMVVWGFRNPLASGFYALGIILLCSHLSHGFSSFLQTLGINNRLMAARITLAGQLLAWLICIGYLSIPFSVLIRFLAPIE
jgi:succinate dehydrogenase / fumarate reductase cytochrome b subunit